MQEVVFENHIYKVSFESMPQSLKETLSKEQLNRYLELLQGVQMQPRAVYNEVKAFCEEHKSIPEVLNLLTFAHIQNHRIVDAEKLIEKTFEDHPDYLFAKINFADQCIRKKKLDLVEQIFPSFALRELCPEKEVFHTSEFRGFMIMMTYYFLAKKDREKALHYFEGARRCEPNHPGVVYLEKKLHRHSLLKRLLGKK